MPLLHVAYFVCAVLAVAFATTRWRTEPVLALILGAAGFGVACGMSVGQIGKSFGTGFGAEAAGPGLAVLAAAFIGSMAEAGGATQFLSALAAPRRGMIMAVTPLAGLVAGLGASPASAFAILRPLGAAVGANPLRLALAMAAGQGLLLPSPVMVAATTILAADWRLVLAIGAPCAAALVLLTNMFKRLPSSPVPPTEEAAPLQPHALPAAALVAVSAVLVALLIVRALGDIPSEPFGGGSARELLLGLGRPFILLLVGLAGMAAGRSQLRKRPGALPLDPAGECLSRPALFADKARRGAFSDPIRPDGSAPLLALSARIAGPGGHPLAGVQGAEPPGLLAITRAAPVVLLLGAAGGLQAIAQDSRMADSLAESLSAWHLGLWVPFLVACCLKMLLGSSPVAAISAAGLLQPALLGLGLDDPAGHACAALAIGAGAVSGSHLNDGFFWLVTDAARLRPAQGMIWVFGGTLLQGAVAVALLSGVHHIVRQQF